jgi:hypothetical protein
LIIVFPSLSQTTKKSCPSIYLLSNVLRLDSGGVLAKSFKRAYSEMVVQLQHCNRLSAPILRDL